MASRAPGSQVCIFCRLQKPLAQSKVHAQRRFYSPAAREDSSRSRHTKTQAPALPQQVKAHPDNRGPVLSKAATENQLNLRTPVDAIREALDPEASSVTWRHELRQAVLRAITGVKEAANDTPQRAQPGPSVVLSDSPSLSADAEPVASPSAPLDGRALSHDEFRRSLASKTLLIDGPKPVRRIMREQLLRCEHVRDILRIIAVATQRKGAADQLNAVSNAICRAAYRCRENDDDPKILATLNTIIARMKKNNTVVDVQLLETGIRFAARTRSLSAMKAYLQEYKQRGLKLTPMAFRSVIGKCSIGLRGLGEKRNGRWRRRELVQVILGFDGVPPEEAHHLGTHLVRYDWTYLHGWIALLSRCKLTDELWKEWLLWLESPLRRIGKPLNTPEIDMDTRTRGDGWLMMHMCLAGDTKRGWQMFHQSGLKFQDLRPPARMLLLQNPEDIGFWDEHVSKSMLDKYDYELSRIEEELGIHWEAGPGGDREKGRHVHTRSLRDTLEIMGAPDYSSQPHGFPLEDDPKGALNH